MIIFIIITNNESLFFFILIIIIKNFSLNTKKNEKILLFEILS